MLSVLNVLIMKLTANRFKKPISLFSIKISVINGKTVANFDSIQVYYTIKDKQNTIKDV